MNNIVYRCNSENQTIQAITDTGANLTIKCPNTILFCAHFSKRCPLDCSNNGICLDNNICQCFSGFSGDDCSICERCTIPSYPDFIDSFKYKSVDTDKSPINNDYDPFKEYYPKSLNSTKDGIGKYALPNVTSGTILYCMITICALIYLLFLSE